MAQKSIERGNFNFATILSHRIIKAQLIRDLVLTVKSKTLKSRKIYKEWKSL